MRHFIIIDDTDQKPEIARIENQVAKDGIKVKGHWLDPTGTSLVDTHGEGADTEYTINFIRLLEYLESNFNRLPIAFVFVDFKLDMSREDGLDVVRYLKSNWRKIQHLPVIMVSGEHAALMKKLEQEWSFNQFDDFKRQYVEIVRHFKLAPVATVDREEYYNEVVGQIKKSEYSLDDMLLVALDEHPEKVFRNVLPNFSGKSLSSISDIIRSENPHNKLLSEKFRNEFVERSVAHFIDLKGE